MSDYTILPDGSAFGTASWPLSKEHWIYQRDGGASSTPPMPLRLGTDDPRRDVFVKAVWDAAKYAIRGATMHGADDGFDPDALCQNMVVGLLGYFTADGLCGESWGDPKELPDLLGSMPKGADF